MLVNDANNDFFVTGTDTNVGKTVLSALLCAALDRMYWKPIQTGMTEGSDRATVIRHAGIDEARTVPETYLFDPPVSPHLAAKMNGTRIDLNRIQRPAIDDCLIIEGAGGALVPINEHDLMTDLISHLGATVLIAARTTLGTINHTLMTVNTIRDAGLKLKGVVLIGDDNRENRDAIEHYGNVAVLGRIPQLESIHREALINAFGQHFDRAAFEGPNS